MQLLHRRQHFRAVAWYDLAAGCISAYQPKGATSLAASYSNLKSPGIYDAYAGTAPTWEANTGWISPDGARFLFVDYTPDANTTLIVRYSLTSGQGCVGGNEDTPGTGVHIYPYYGGSIYFRHGGSVGPVSGAAQSGVVAVKATQGYLNGASKGGAIPSGTYCAYGVCWLSCRVGATSQKNRFTGSIAACALYAAALSPEAIATVSDAMAAL